MEANSKLKPIPLVELVTEPLSVADLNDLCDSTDAAIDAGGGFGWIKLPNRDILERFWQGVVTMPARMLFVARLDDVICGAAQLIRPAKNNEAQSFVADITGFYLAMGAWSVLSAVFLISLKRPRLKRAIRSSISIYAKRRKPRFSFMKVRDIK